jgi:hypothetical protein
VIIDRHHSNGRAVADSGRLGVFCRVFRLTRNRHQLRKKSSGGALRREIDERYADQRRRDRDSRARAAPDSRC